MLVIVLLFTPKNSFAQENAAIDDIIEGFDEDEKDAFAIKPEEASEPSIFSMDGYIKLGSSCNVAHDAPEAGETDWRGLSRLLVEMRIELNARFSDSWQAIAGGRGAYDSAYLIRGRDEFTDEVLDNYEREFELLDVYLLGSPLNSLDVKVGRQIVVWGKSDNIRVADVLNPLDMREPGITDIENLRLPVTMTRIDCFFGDWSITGIALHEIRFNKSPEYGSDFYPAAYPQPCEEKIEHGGKNTEFAAALNGIFSKWDIAFYWAGIHDDMPHMEPVPLGIITLFEMKHARVMMLGVSSNAALGNFLVKAESAYFEGLRFYYNKGCGYSRIDILAGIEYTGFTDTTVSIEVVNRHINDFDKGLEQLPDYANENEFQSVIRLTRSLLNETLKLTILASTFGWAGQDGAFQRFSAEYDIMDALKISGGVVLYESGGLAKFRNIEDNDRLFLEMKYSF